MYRDLNECKVTEVEEIICLCFLQPSLVLYGKIHNVALKYLFL